MGWNTINGVWKQRDGSAVDLAAATNAVAHMWVEDGGTRYPVHRLRADDVCAALQERVDLVEALYGVTLTAPLDPATYGNTNVIGMNRVRTLWSNWKTVIEDLADYFVAMHEADGSGHFSAAQLAGHSAPVLSDDFAGWLAALEVDGDFFSSPRYHPNLGRAQADSGHQAGWHAFYVLINSMTAVVSGTARRWVQDVLANFDELDLVEDLPEDAPDPDLYFVGRDDLDDYVSVAKVGLGGLYTTALGGTPGTTVVDHNLTNAARVDFRMTYLSADPYSIESRLEHDLPGLESQPAVLVDPVAASVASVDWYVKRNDTLAEDILASAWGGSGTWETTVDPGYVFYEAGSTTRTVGGDVYAVATTITDSPVWDWPEDLDDVLSYSSGSRNWSMDAVRTGRHRHLAVLHLTLDYGTL